MTAYAGLLTGLLVVAGAVLVAYAGWRSGGDYIAQVTGQKVDQSFWAFLRDSFGGKE